MTRPTSPRCVPSTTITLRPAAGAGGVEPLSTPGCLSILVFLPADLLPQRPDRRRAARRKARRAAAASAPPGTGREGSPRRSVRCPRMTILHRACLAKRLLLAALAVAGPAAAQGGAASVPSWSKGAPLTITVTNQGFTPRRIAMKSGQGYVLHVANRSDRGHNFSARSFFKLARVDPRDQAWVAEDEIKLAAGQRATVHIIAPTTPGARYDYRSTVLADAGEKMRGAIYVR